MVIFVFLFDNLLKIKYKFIEYVDSYLLSVLTDAASVRFFLNYPLYWGSEIKGADRSCPYCKVLILWSRLSQ